MRFTSFLLFAGAQSVLASTCKCTPADACWPSFPKWNSLNGSVDGQLVHNQPIAKPCYPGQGYDARLCQQISKEWTDSTFRESQPVGYTYPLANTCPPVNASEAAFPLCDLGNVPVYTINATKADHVAAGIRFARENNVRLVVKNTGHDIVGRSQGYGSLMIWIKYIQDGLHYQEHYMPSNGSCRSNWTESAITVGGGYVWNDAYAFAGKHGRIVVGGDDRSVGAIGGYLQGGGHGPASHSFGLATDQVLEYKVVLASGAIVTASACQHTDLFTALRGGGGGTFGVVVSATIKAHKTRPVLAHTLEVVPLNGSITPLLNASAYMLSKYPLVSDEGFAGNAEIIKTAAQALYEHTFIKLIESNSSAAQNATIEHAKRVMNQQIVNTLAQSNKTSLYVKSSFKLFPSFQEYFLGSGKHQATASNNLIMASRFFDKKSVLYQQKKLSGMLHTLFSADGPVHAASSVLEVCLIGGGHVLQPAPHTSVNPAWRKTYVLAEHLDFWPENYGSQEIRQIKHDATFKKLKAMKDVAPDTGTYLNEADGYDPDWKKDWYGDRYDWLRTVKQQYDPDDVFWCWRCVGSEGWDEVNGGTTYGPLCKT